MKQELEKIIQNIDGNVLAIGIKEEKFIKALEDNLSITNCYFLNVISKNHHSDETKTRKTKNFSIRNLRKRFHKKKVDYIICNMEEIKPFFKTFIKDSVYINRKKLYFYGKKNNFELDKIVKRYQNYHATIKKKDYGTFFLVTISNEHSKTNKIKDIWFSTCDFFEFLYETIGDLLIN